MIRIVKISFILLFGLLSTVTYSQVEASASLDSNKILIGDQVKLQLDLKVDKSKTISWPLFSDTLTNMIEIVRQSDIDTLQSDGLLSLKQELTITSFDSGYWVIPPIQFKYDVINDTTFSYTSTEPLLLEVQTLEVDTSQAIKPIKGIKKAPVTTREILIILLLLAIVGGIAFLVYYIVKRAKTKQPLLKKLIKPAIPPHQLALQELENLKQKKLWQAGKTKDYYSELTDIVRTYIDGRFDIDAMEMTTYEIQSSFDHVDLDPVLKTKLFEMLTLADLVKFAKAKPLPDENNRHLSFSFEFVQKTIPVVKTEKEEETNNKENKENV